MKYVIYGANRVAKDFLYMFDHLEITGVVDREWRGESFASYPVYGEAYLKKRDKDEQIIVCDFEKEEKLSRLEEEGFLYGTDYVCEEDFFAQLDEFQIPPDRKLVMWGTGKMAGWFHENYAHYEPDFYLDSYNEADTFCGKEIRRPEEISNWQELFVIIGVDKDKGIRAWLEQAGLTEFTDYVSYQSVTGMPSELLRKTIFDRAYYDLECNTMRNHLEILHDGDTRCCCTTFVRQNLDNIFRKDIHALWKSARHKVMCLSTENRTYTFCDKSMCPLFVSKNREAPNGLDRPYEMCTDIPEVLVLGYDATCNLACSTCRKEIHAARDKELEMVRRITEKVQKEYLPGCRFLVMAGDGEVFASPDYRKIYESEDCKPQYIRLLSNGMLFTPENWKRFVSGKTGKMMLTVSVDAATKETYEKIRRKGRFDVLKKNMEFASELRKKGELSYFRMNFVVQRENYMEMIPFVRWGEELGVDEVFFTKILNWGTYTPEEFCQISMMEPDGITPKPELKKVLEDPVMKSEIVDLGTIQYSHKADQADIVENYYMWELEKRGGRLFI